MAPDKQHRFEMRADDAFSKSIDDWRRKQPDLPGRAEAIRRLVELGLTVPHKATAKATK
jgi:hypothetical protein